jgi:nucleotide-binding universal stress UspA family protein
MTTKQPSSIKEPTHRVVVGIDGSEGGNRALEWAATEAARRGAVLEAHTTYGPGYEFITPQEVHMAMQRVLDQAENHIADIAPGLVFEGVMHDGPAAKFLIEASKDADLLVVGSRGLGGFKGLMLGSVSRHCSHHAHCPILIVRASEGSRSDEAVGTAGSPLE